MTLPVEWSDFARAVGAQYNVTSELGRGGMAVVLLASDTRHGRDVAIKVFRPEVSAAVAEERFQREIHIAARLNHPHILPLFDSGAAAGYLFYVMPFVRGETLRHRLDREGALSLESALRLVEEMCGALDYAHREGVVHRDLKPENILLSEGHAILADFGIAHAIDQAGGGRLTTLGLTLGTPAYISPEQASGEPVDGRSDEYSIACVTFEMLTGRAPFPGPTAMAYLSQHLTQSPPLLTTVRPELPEHVERALQCAMQKAADDRYESTAAFASALAAPAVIQTTEPRDDTIAILDFANISGDASIQWLSSGMAETLGVDLNRASSVRIVRREKLARALSSRSAPVTSEQDALQVAHALGARWVVWGAYQVAGDRIRITPRFGNVSGGSMSATAKLDGNLRDIFALQDQLVEELLSALNVEVSLAQRASMAKPDTKSVTAFELFARARQLQHQFTPTAIIESRVLLHDAISRDPDFALAHSGLGFSFAFAFIGNSNPDDLASALVHLDRAVTLDAGLGEAYAWQSYALARSGRDTDALVAGERAVSLEPDFGTAHYFLAFANLLGSEHGGDRWFQRTRAVLALFNAVQADPGSQATYHVLADLYMLNGQYDDARAPIQRALDIENGVGRTSIVFVGALMLAGILALQTGEISRADELLRQAIARYELSSHLYAQVLLALSYCGLGEVARRTGHFDDALIAAQHAVRICHEHPGQVGTGFVLVRAHLLAAKANFALGIHGSARTELADSVRLLTDRVGFSFAYFMQANIASATSDCAAAYAVLGKTDDALAWLERAYDVSWNDHAALGSNPDFARLRPLPEFVAFVERCERRGRHPAPGAACDGRSETRSATEQLRR